MGLLQAKTGAVVNLRPLFCLSQKGLRHQGTRVDDQIGGLDDLGAPDGYQFPVSGTRPNEVDFSLLYRFQFSILHKYLFKGWILTTKSTKVTKKSATNATEIISIL